MSLFIALLLAQPAWAAFPAASSQIADCENHWVLVADKKDPDLRVLGFAYVDPEAGFTLEDDGEVGLDGKGDLVRKPNALAGKARLIVRVGDNINVACLDEATVAKLGLPAQWPYLKAYQDKRDPVAHAIAWASHLNQIGAYQQALRQTDVALKAGDDSAAMWFERAYAWDAQGQFEQTIAALEPVVARQPDAIALLGELAFAHMNHRDFPRAIELYRRAIDDYAKATVTTPGRWEYAQNLAHIYSEMGNGAAEGEWLAKAKAWRPPPDSSP